MNKELVKLAKEKGFDGYFPKEWTHNSKESLRYYFWMCELQQWLRDNKEIMIFSVYKTFGIESCNGFYFTTGKSDFLEGKYSTYEKALEGGLLYALNSL